MDGNINPILSNMEITVIKVGYSVRQILFGSPNEQTKKWVSDLNANPLMSEEATIEQCHTDKSIYDVAEFLGIQ